MSSMSDSGESSVVSSRRRAEQERGDYSEELTIREVLDALQQHLAQLQVRCFSTYHACAAIADIAHAGMEVQSIGTPYFSSIEALARKEDEHAALVSDLFATCEQLIVELRTAVASVESVERETIPAGYDEHS
ncbi:MAG: hypothetical protein KatS3mg039_1731 [Candidatus Kapaibacterium sp.]|nr:MAG: hypothetical protein KatS3mg039_1731 [Candidatus Kapabacteria bacterium]GIV55309.1 MAG: hypothetical protein KatS3mg040_0077 [Candidatus Kapabacteria bacterium]